MRCLLLVLSLACAVEETPTPAGPPPPRPVGAAPPRDEAGAFVDISEWAGLGGPLQSPGDGITAFDLDRDGDDDLLVPRVDSGLAFYRNQADGSFGYAEPVPGIGSAQAAYVAELTGDGAPDVLAIDSSNLWLLEVDSGGSLRIAREFPELVSAGRFSIATFGDFSFSGRLGVYVGRMPDGGDDVPVAERRTRGVCGEETFPSSFDPVPGLFLEPAGLTDATAAAGITAITRAQAALAADVNSDGALDLVIGTEGKHEDLVYLGDGRGRFVERGASLGYTEKTSAMGFDVADVDGDGVPEIAVADSNPVLRLWVSDGKGAYRDEAPDRGFDVVSSFSSWGIGFVDFDLDGDLDFFSANSRPEADGCTSPAMERLLFMNDGLGHFERFAPDAATPLDEISEARGAAFADFDLDGDVDVAVASVDREPQILRNDLPRLGHTLFVSLDFIYYSPAVGAVVHVDAGGKRFSRWVVGTPSFGGSSSEWIHFGLGSATTYDSIEVRWPHGVVQKEVGGPADRRVAIRLRQ